MNKLISFFLSLVLLMSISVTTAFAVEPTASQAPMAATDQIQPRGTIVTVPSYFYSTEAYDGNYTSHPIVEKEITIPDGMRLVSSDMEISYFKHNSYYQNVKYATVTKWVWNYSFVRA